MADLGSDVDPILDADVADDVRIPVRKAAVPGWLYLTIAQVKAAVLKFIPYNVPFAFATPAPLTAEKLLLHVFTEEIIFADDFAGSEGYVGTNPTASFVMLIKQNGSDIGTITVSTGGAVTFATTGGAATFAVGDILEVRAPVTTDATAANMAFTFKGNRT